MARLFTIASDETLISMISTAIERLVIVAPGMSKKVASVLAERIEKGAGPHELSVTLDVDPEVCRLGYGDIESFELLRPALESRTRVLQTQKGVRIGLVVADSDVLVYSPTPQLIEAGSTAEEKPNAIRITSIGPEEIALACGARDEQVLGAGQEVGLTIASEAVVQETKADLKENPPRKFDLVRLERVFNYKLEFVEFSIERYRLNTRSVPLPATLLGLADKELKDRLRNTFRVFEAGVPFKFKIPDPNDSKTILTVTEKWLTDEADKLRKDYFVPLGSSSYGNLILKRRKPDFLGKVTRLTSLIDSYAAKVRDSIAAKVHGTRDNLIKALFPRVKADPPAGWLNHSVDGVLNDAEIKRRLEQEVDHAFEKVEESFAPKITCIFKGVQYETITQDEHFKQRIKDYFGDESATQLFSEHDASRAQELTLK
jgi:hypothetical protein